MEGFGPVPPVKPNRLAIDEDAADFLARTAHAHPGEVTICAIGPITNVAEALRRHPDFVTNVADIVVMGGAVNVPGNVTPFAEANTYQDPHALADVLASGVRTTIIGLDVTVKVLADRADFAALAARHPEHGAFLQAASRDYISVYEARGRSGCALHDPLAVIACVAPDLVEIEEMPLTVVIEGAEMGRTKPGHGPMARVGLDVDADAVKERFFSMFR